MAPHTRNMGRLLTIMSATGTPAALEVMPGAPCMMKSVVRAHP